MLRASLGAADCDKRLSIADEEGVQTARQTRVRNEICLERTREGWMHEPTECVISYYIPRLLLKK
jgi:hypothetical protein